MDKRVDAEFLKRIIDFSKQNKFDEDIKNIKQGMKKHCIKSSSLPLIKIRDIYQDQIAEIYDHRITDQSDHSAKRFQDFDFYLFDKCVFYFDFYIGEHGVSFHVLAEGNDLSCIAIFKESGAVLNFVILKNFPESGFYQLLLPANPMDIDKNDLEITRAFAHLVLCCLKLSLEEIENSDKHPVAKQPTIKNKKINKKDKKPWLNPQGATVIFLDKMPSDKKDYQGGNHKSPKGHQRRGHARMLRHEKYKNHPKFGESIYIKPVWIGEKSKEYQGNTYTLLEGINHA